MARDLPTKTFAIVLRGRFNRVENDYEAIRIDAHSEDHACCLASLQGIERRTIAQAINIASKLYQRFVESHHEVSVSTSQQSSLLGRTLQQ